MMTEQVFAQAVLLSGAPEEQRELLRVFCGTAVSVLTARLRDGLTPEDCGGNFVTAASLYALAAMGKTGTQVEEFKAGDLTVRKGGGSAMELEEQAWKLLAPYLKDAFLFAGV